MARLPAPRVCTAVVVERDGRVLLLKRSPGCWAWPGHWAMPGGRLEPGESLAECCARELCEETGLRAGSFAFAGLTETVAPDSHLIGLVHRARDVAGEPENRLPGAHDAIGWFPWDALPAPLMPGVAQFARETGLGRA